MDEVTSVTDAEYTDAVITALKDTQKTMSDLKDLLPKNKVKEFEDLEKQTFASYMYNGEVLGTFFNAFLQRLPTEIKETLCPQLIKNFNSNGFPSKAREGVCSS